MSPSKGKIKEARKTYIACGLKTPHRKTGKVNTHQEKDGQRDTMVKRTQAEEVAVEKTIGTLLADDACQNVGRSRNASVSRTSFSWHARRRTDL